MPDPQYTSSTTRYFPKLAAWSFILSRDHSVTWSWRHATRVTWCVICRVTWPITVTCVVCHGWHYVTWSLQKKGNNLCKYPQLPPEPQSASSSLAITGIYRLNVKKRIFSLYPVYWFPLIPMHFAHPTIAGAYLLDLDFSISLLASESGDVILW